MNAPTKTSATGRSGGRLDRAIVVLEALAGIGVIAALVGKGSGPVPTVTFVFAALAVAGTGFVLLRMFGSLSDRTLDVPGPVVDEQREVLEEEKWILLQGIKEFESDAGAGKVDEKDYQHLRKTAEARALQIISTLKRSDDDYRKKAEALILSRLGPTARSLLVSPTGAQGESVAAPLENATSKNAAVGAVGEAGGVKELDGIAKSSDLSCGGCQTKNDLDARFCIGCGRPLLTAGGNR